MTEDAWLTCGNPGNLLDFLGSRLTPRKKRLFGCACVRRVPQYTQARQVRNLLRLAEQCGDGAYGPGKLARVFARYGPGDVQGSAQALRYICFGGVDSAHEVAYLCRLARRDNDELKTQAQLLRDLFNPFRRDARFASAHPWRTPLVRGLAQAIYDGQTTDHLPILADALEDDGCTDEALLEHCRGSAVHIRGCWALDYLLGKS